MKVYLFIVTYIWRGESKRRKWVSPCVYNTELEAKAAAYGSWSYYWTDLKFYVKSVKV